MILFKQKQKVINIKKVDLFKALPVVGCILKSKSPELEELLDVGKGRKSSKEIQTLMIVDKRIKRQYNDLAINLDDYYKKTYTHFKGKGYTFILVSCSLHQQDLGQGRLLNYIEITKFRRLDAKKYSRLITMQIECAKHFMNIHLNMTFLIDVASYINLFQGGLPTNVTAATSTSSTHLLDSKILNKTFLRTILNFESLLTFKRKNHENSTNNNNTLTNDESHLQNQIEQNHKSLNYNGIVEEKRVANSQFNFHKQITLAQLKAKELLAGSSSLVYSNLGNQINLEEKDSSIKVSKAENDNDNEDVDSHHNHNHELNDNILSDNHLVNRQISNINLDESDNFDDSQTQHVQEEKHQQRYHQELEIGDSVNSYRVGQKKNTDNSIKRIANLPQTDPKFKQSRFPLEREVSFFQNTSSLQMIQSPKFSEKVNLLQESGTFDHHEGSKNETDFIGLQGLDPYDQSTNHNILSGRSQPSILSSRTILTPNQSAASHQINHDPSVFTLSYNNNKNNQQMSNIRNNGQTYQNQIQSSKEIGYIPQEHEFIHLQKKNNQQKGSMIEQQNATSNGNSKPQMSNKMIFLNKNFNSTLDNFPPPPPLTPLPALPPLTGYTSVNGSTNTITSTNQINSLTSLSQMNNMSHKLIKEDNLNRRRRKSLFSQNVTGPSLSPQKKMSHLSQKNRNNQLDSTNNGKDTANKQEGGDQAYDHNKYNFDQFQFYGGDHSQEIWEHSSESNIEELEQEDEQNYQHNHYSNNMKHNSLDVVNEEAEIMDYSHFLSNRKKQKQQIKNKGGNNNNNNGEGQDSSIHSSQTQSSSRRQYVMKVLKSRRQSKLFLTANIIGYLGIILLLAMTSGLYAQTLVEYGNQNYSMVSMPLSTDLYSTYNHLIKNKNLQQLYTVNLFNINTQQLSTLTANLSSKEISLFAQFKVSVYSVVMAKANMSYISYLYDTTMELTLFPTPLVYDNPITISYSILYSFMILLGYLHTYIFPQGQFDSIIGEVFSATNVQSYQVYLTKMEDMVVQVTSDSFSQIDYIYNVSLSIIVIISFFVVVLIFIMNIIFIHNRETILKLFSTFSPQLLQNLIHNLDDNLKQLFSIRTYMNLNLNNHVSNHNIANNQKKASMNIPISSGVTTKGGGESINSLSRLQLSGRKTISLTSKLQKFNFTSIFISITVLAVVSTYPLANLLIKNSFKKESQTHVDELGYILSIPAHLGQCLFAHYGVMGFRIKGFTDHKDPQNIYYTMVNELASSNQSKVDNLYSLLEVAQRYYGTDQTDYNTQFYPILNSNACNVLASNQKYNDADIIHSCNTIFSGIFQQGYILGLKKFLNIMDQLQEIYIDSTPDNLIANINAWNLNVNSDTTLPLDSQVQGIVALDEAYEIMIVITQFLNDFVLDQYQSSYDQSNLYLILLFVYSILIYLILFFFGWFKFFHSHLKIIHKTRNLLSIFQIATLIENPYIMSYFKQIRSYTQETISSRA